MKLTLYFVFRNSIPQVKAQANSAITNKTLEAGNTYMKVTASATQKSRISKNHFNMFNSLRRVKYQV